ncbi:MAG: hypothetical protein A3J79_07455 [Elusimicrobia bacterium RIFOXYB2_FULL_62_6]|nr:MAG: hypothetical protein A3J79_07455 [Elusimicrobia bacterium RIFOXYB2_FULL_62_6]
MKVNPWRAAASELAGAFIWLLYFLLILTGLLALGTFNPFRSSWFVLGGALALAALLAAVWAHLSGLHWRVMRAFGRSADGLPEEPRYRQLLALLPAALLPAAFAAAALAVTHLVWHARIAALTAEAKAKGLPTTLADFAEKDRQGLCAHDALEKVLKDFDDAFLRTASQRKTGLQKWNKDMYADAERMAAHYGTFMNKEFLPALSCAPRFRNIDYRAAGRDPDSLPRFESDKYFRIARLLRLQALSLAYRGDMNGAWKLIGRIFDLGGLFAADRDLELKMAALSFLSQGAEASIATMRNRPGARLPAAITARLAGAQREHLVRDGVRWQLARKLDFRNVYEPLIITGGKKMITRNCHGPCGALSEETLLNLAARYVVLAGALDAGYFRLAQYLSGMGQDESLRYSKRPYTADWPLWPYTIAQFEWPQYSGFHFKEREFRTWARLALVMSALEEYRAARRALPAALEDLAPGYIAAEHLADPVSGKTFHYARAPGERYTVCGYGGEEDRKDSRGGDFCVQSPS